MRTACPGRSTSLPSEFMLRGLVAFIDLVSEGTGEETPLDDPDVAGDDGAASDRGGVVGGVPDSCREDEAELRARVAGEKADLTRRNMAVRTMLRTPGTFITLSAASSAGTVLLIFALLCLCVVCRACVRARARVCVFLCVPRE